MLKEKSAKAKIVSGSLTFVIIMLLILAGPAQAFSFDIIPSKDSAPVGEEVSFVIEVDIPPGERIPLEYLELELGPIICRFKPDGGKISGCDDLVLDKISDANYSFGYGYGNNNGTDYNFGYGYGYGYGYGQVGVESLAYNITLNTNVLGEGIYTPVLRAKISGEDDVFEKEGSNFNVLPIESGFNITVNSPLEGFSNSRNVKLNLSVSEIAKRISYINYNDSSPNEKRLCKDCEGFGELNMKRLSLREGENKLKFIAESYLGEITEKEVTVFVDTKDPKIIGSSPRSGFIENNIELFFEEKNPDEVLLTYGNNLNGFNNIEVNITESCTLDKFYKCEIFVDLSNYSEQEISYFFMIVDVAGNSDKSVIRRVKVDEISPVLNSFNYTLKGGRIHLIFNVSETNFHKIVYLDSAGRTNRENTLCSILRNGLCIRNPNLTEGEHELEFRIYDKAKNFEHFNLSVFIDSKKPRIFKIEPSRGTATGEFKVEFKEKNPINVSLNYGNNAEGFFKKELDIDSECTNVLDNYKCSTSVDLSAFAGEKISFWFEVFDIGGNMKKRSIRKVSVA